MSSNLLNAKGDKFNNNNLPVLEDGVYKFHFTQPDKGIYNGKIYSINPNNSYNTIAEFFINNSIAGEKLPVSGKLFLLRRFTENGFELLSENISKNNNLNYYEVSVRSTKDWLMNCRVTDQADKRIEENYGYTKNGEIYTFFFSNHTKSGDLIGKIYDMNSEGSLNTIATFKIDEKDKKNREIPPKNKLIIYNLFYQSGFELVKHNCDKKRINYEITIDSKNTFEMKCSLRDSLGKSFSKNYTIDKTDNIYSFTFDIKEIDTGEIKIFMVDKEGKTRTVVFYKF